MGWLKLLSESLYINSEKFHNIPINNQVLHIFGNVSCVLSYTHVL